MKQQYNDRTIPRIALLLALLVAGCTPQQSLYKEDVTAKALTSGGTVHTRVLAAAEDWRNSGVEVAEGQEYGVTATGKWKTYGTCNVTGPDGVGMYGPLCFKLPLFPEVISGFSHSTLIARIGDEGAPFAIGDNLKFVAQASGPLYFRINDTYGATADNEGYADVEVTAFGGSQPEITTAPAAQMALAAQVAAAASGVPRVALVIGNSNYQQSPLKNPVNDANAMAESLRRLGFSVILKLDANQREMELAIDEFGRKLVGGQHVALFYFAGHGVQVDGSNYLIPTEAAIRRQSDVRYKAVDVGQVLGAMGEATDNLNIVILDACRDNPLPRSFRSSARGLAQVHGPKGTIIGFATSPGSTAADGEGDHGVYTKHLLESLPEPGISIEQVFKRVLQGVNAETGGLQTPWTESSFTGDFSFNPG